MTTTFVPFTIADYLANAEDLKNKILLMFSTAYNNLQKLKHYNFKKPLVSRDLEVYVEKLKVLRL